jgi:ribosome-associated heat shock protein Hsp15
LGNADAIKYVGPFVNGKARAAQSEKRRRKFGIWRAGYGRLPFMAETLSVRLDKWLWAVRVFKTRALACAACRQGQVTISGQPAKPSREVRVNDVLVVRKDNLSRQFKVLQLLDHRVGAPKARDYAEDQTAPSEFEKPREPNFRPLFFRPKGAGRPTKKERRDMGRFAD